MTKLKTHLAIALGALSLLGPAAVLAAPLGIPSVATSNTIQSLAPVLNVSGEDDDDDDAGVRHHGRKGDHESARDHAGKQDDDRQQQRYSDDDDGEDDDGEHAARVSNDPVNTPPRDKGLILKGSTPKVQIN